MKCEDDRLISGQAWKRKVIKKSVVDTMEINDISLGESFHLSNAKRIQTMNIV
jgi:hypothetical protein